MTTTARAGTALVGAIATGLALAASAAGHGEHETRSAAAAASGDPRYALAGGCYAIRSESSGRFLAHRAGGLRADAALAGDAARFRMEPTRLGRYLLFDAHRRFLAKDTATGIVSAAHPSAAADWAVDTARGAFTISSTIAPRSLAIAPNGGRLMLVGAGSGGAAGRFAFEPVQGCAQVPEVEVNAVGEPLKGATPYEETRGLIDAHAHMMAFEAFGGGLHCGRSWHPLGVTQALVDCPDHQPNGEAAVVENFASHGMPTGTHDTEGWPSFKGWPKHDSLTHESVYYKWVERTYRAGLRVFVMLAVDNSALCLVNPYRTYECNDMQAVYREIQDTYALQDYIDARNGGPGQGWFRIVRDPFEARRVINEGKLAVILGIEVSEIFDCGLRNDVPQCDRAQIDRELDKVYELGVRQMELVNKYDNALAGVAFDTDVTGAIVNTGNFLRTGRYWEMETCKDPEAADNKQISAGGNFVGDVLTAGLGALLPAGTLPVYPKAPHCNTKGLTSLGEYAIRRMMAKGMVFDPDHMSVLARKHALDLLEANRYSGAISSHSWSDMPSYTRIQKLGGLVTPMGNDSPGFVKDWQRLRRNHPGRYLFGIGFGDDMNGFASKPGPRADSAANPVGYPFRSFDGGTTLDRQRSGERVYDFNRDGLDHFGLYPDWVEDLRKVGGDQIVKDMSQGAEAYLQMWERANGVPGPACRPKRGEVTTAGLGAVRLGDTPEQLLRRAGQPGRRLGRSYRYCVKGDANAAARVVAVHTPGGRVGFVASTARGHTARGLRTGSRARRLRGRAQAIGRGLYLGPPRRSGARLVYGVRKGRVSFVGVASSSAAAGARRLDQYRRAARLR
jgi:microsomal dipeptidase-like Zn-dependent dipeptidase